MGFGGWVMSDWAATHGVASARAGLDQDMPGSDVDDGWTASFSRDNLVTLHDDLLDAMAKRVLTPMAAYGLLDAPADDAAAWCAAGVDCAPFLYDTVATSAAHAALAREIATESVLHHRHPLGAFDRYS